VGGVLSVLRFGNRYSLLHNPKPGGFDNSHHVAVRHASVLPLSFLVQFFGDIHALGCAALLEVDARNRRNDPYRDIWTVCFAVSVRDDPALLVARLFDGAHHVAF
jgi:hypothetical protein